MLLVASFCLKNCKFYFEKVVVTVTTTFKNWWRQVIIVTYKVAPMVAYWRVDGSGRLYVGLYDSLIAVNDARSRDPANGRRRKRRR